MYKCEINTTGNERLGFRRKRKNIPSVKCGQSIVGSVTTGHNAG